MHQISIVFLLFTYIYTYLGLDADIVDGHVPLSVRNPEAAGPGDSARGMEPAARQRIPR